ncbi:CheB methylesterase domain-containing protein [Helicobacter mesocricetorum]|uniref:CheB methylesterase domain-containing protein n=1 Tax=Helicobacter mesocricetorum TaxID=87012 RepID=UPI000CF076FF|nr:CheB methylesterase domain-containing protein [Helicobacter mesocricetorum]
MENYEKHHPDLLLKSSPYKGESKKVIGIGASTGGIDAIVKILQNLPANLPPIVITQHIPAGFSASFAERLNEVSTIEVYEVNKKMILKSSCAYLAAGGTHLLLKRSGSEYSAEPLEGERISRHKPSVDIMFRGLNNIAGRNALAIILTGMGDDGSIGIKELHKNGAYTIAQDEASCVVFGMPKQAISRGAVTEVVSLDNIPSKIVKFSEGGLVKSVRGGGINVLPFTSC